MLTEDIECKFRSVDIDDDTLTKWKEEMRSMGYDPDKVTYRKLEWGWGLSDKCKERERAIGRQEAKEEIIKVVGGYTPIPPKSDKGSASLPEFSALEWGTIFYYAVGCELTPGENNISAELSKFHAKHRIAATVNSLRQSYYKAKKQLDYTSDRVPRFLIGRLEAIIPFLTDNYPRSVVFVESDLKMIRGKLD